MSPAVMTSLVGMVRLVADVVETAEGFSPVSKPVAALVVGLLRVCADALEAGENEPAQEEALMKADELMKAALDAKKFGAAP